MEAMLWYKVQLDYPLTLSKAGLYFSVIVNLNPTMDT